MYDLIQSALTAATEIIAIAGLTGIAAHAMWKQHTNWMSSYCPAVAPCTPDVQAEGEIATPEPQPEPEVASRPVGNAYHHFRASLDKPSARINQARAGAVSS